jgi:orotidine-5'-phosphate decarboxylase
MKAADRIIVALDVDTRERALACVHQLMPQAKYFKVGSQLFTACGPGLVAEIVRLGARVFLDLKFHDIPQTVAHAVIGAARLGATMITVHASGGMPMLEAASRALAHNFNSSTRPRLIAVTMLTSLSETDTREIGFTLPLREQSVRLAHLAQRAGMDGVVASPLEIQAIRQACGDEFLIVTPGVRPSNSIRDDHVRIAAPKAALEAGANYLVIGRPILEAPDPLLALQEIAKSIKPS